METNNGMHWLSEKEYQKAVGQLRLQFNAVFKPFMMYGLQEYVPGAIVEAVKLAEDFSLRTRGVDKPISIESVRRNKRR